MITEQEKLQIRKGFVDREVERTRSVLTMPDLDNGARSALEARLAALVAEQSALMQHPLLVNQEGVSSSEGGWNNPADPEREQAGPYPGSAPV